MSGSHPERVVDPVCGMTVDVARAEAAGLTFTHAGRTYAFCGPGCLRSFRDGPEASATTAPASTAERALPIIDEGMRRWYESCSCCLSEAYPEIKAALDAEREARSAASVGPGICEVAEA